MKKLLKKISPLLVILALTLALPMIAQADTEDDEIPTKGHCGKYSAWSFDEKSHTLTIQGKGKMFGKEEWEELKINKVKIKDGITEIGSYAFSELKKLESVELADSVETIHHAAFSYTGLKEITVPKTIKKMGGYVFANCYKLKKVTWWYDDIPDRTFYRCPSLSEIKIEGKIHAIGEEAFSHTAIKKFDMPDSVKHIESDMFYGCKNLTSVTMSSNIKVIPSYAFNKTPALKTITLNKGLTTIHHNAFQNCGVKNLIIPNTVTDIKKSAFYKAKQLETIKLSNNVKLIKDNTFEECKSLRSIDFGSSVTYIGESAFLNCDSLKNLVIPSTVKTLDYKAFESSGCETVTLSEGVKNVDYWVFNECKKLKSITIPGSVTTFQTNALASCPALTTITVADTNQKYTSLDNCLVTKDLITLLVVPASKTGTYVIPDGVKKIDNEAFDGCSGITAYSEGTNPNFKAVEGLLCDVTGTTIIAAPQGKTGIVTIPNGIVKIGPAAFQYSQASGIVLPDSVQTLSYCAFEYCSNLTYIKIPGTIAKIPNACFWDCKNLKKVDVEYGVRKIKRNAFHGCEKLKKIVLPASLTCIRSTAFSDCNRITFYCKKSSLAMSFATKYYYSYKVI